MPPRKRESRNTEDTKTYFHVVVTDAEGNSIRFGPFTEDDLIVEGPDGTPETFKPAVFAQDFAEDVAELGLEQALAGLYLWGNLTVRMTGDDGSTYPLCDIPNPTL